MVTSDGPRPTKLVWGPTIDAALCDGCRTCVDLCHNDVFGWTGDKAVVANKANCVAGCSHCATLCEAGAISFPSVDELRASRRKG